MKFAICNETFQDWPFEKAFAFASELGYTGIEIAPFTIGKNAFDISPQRRAEVRRQAEQAGLEVVGLHWLLAFTEGYYLTSPDKTVRRKTTDYLAELARLCRDLGGTIMVLGSPKQRNLLPGVTSNDAMQYAAEVIGGAVEVFQECEVTLAVEPLGPQEGDFLLTADAGVDLIELVDSPCCRLHLDVKAMSSEGTPIPDIIRDHAEWLVHFHANDANRRGPGMGEIDFVPIFAALEDVHYDGWVSVEVFDYEPGIETLASESLVYMQQCLTNLLPGEGLTTEYGRHFSDSSFWQKVTKYARVAGREVVEKSLRLFYTLHSPKTPAWAKAVIITALGYFIFPLDAVPDYLPVAGYADDLGALLAALATVAAYITGDIKELARKKADEWFGSNSSGDLLK